MKESTMLILQQFLQLAKLHEAGQELETPKPSAGATAVGPSRVNGDTANGAWDFFH